MLELNKVYNMDCMDGFDRLEDDSIDLIVIDPPYFLPANHYNTRKKYRRNLADLGILEHFFRDVFKEIGRVLKPTGRIYVFCDGQSYPIFFYHLYPFCKSVRPLIWDKKTSINGYSWRHQHEIIIFAEMPETKPVPTGDGDILRYPAVKASLRKHQAEKPVELLMRLIKKSSQEKDIVLDCFGGGGSTGIACKNTNRNYILFEKSKEYCDIAIKRLSEKSLLPLDVNTKEDGLPPTPKGMGIRPTIL